LLLEKPRIGVVLSNGECIGSIFINFNSTLSESRVLIDEIIKDYDISRHSNSFEYRFVDKHGWPVIYAQEKNLLHFVCGSRHFFYQKCHQGDL